MVFPIALALMATGANKMAKNARLADEDRERRQRAEDENAAYQKELRDRQRKQWERDDKLQSDVAAAAQPAKVEEVTIPPTMDNRDVGQPGEQALGVRVNGSAPMAPDQAKATAAGYNTRGATMRRQADALRANGKVQEAEKALDIAEQLDREGVMAFVERNLSRAPTIEAIKAPGAAVDFDLDGIPDFNAVGKSKIPEGTRGRWVVKKLPGGREIVDFVAVGKDGKADETLSARQIEAIYGMTRAERERMEAARYKDGVEADNKDADNKRADRLVDAQVKKYEEEAKAAGRRWMGGGVGGGAGGQGGAGGFSLPPGLDLKEARQDINRIGDLARKHYGAPEGELDQAKIEAGNARAEALALKGQQVFIGAAQSGQVITADMALEIAMRGKPKQIVQRNPQTGEQRFVPGVEFNGRIFPLYMGQAQPDQVGGGRGFESSDPRRLDQPQPAAQPAAAPTMRAQAPAPAGRPGAAFVSMGAGGDPALAGAINAQTQRQPAPAAAPAAARPSVAQVLGQTWPNNPEMRAAFEQRGMQIEQLAGAWKQAQAQLAAAAQSRDPGAVQQAAAAAGAARAAVLKALATVPDQLRPQIAAMVGIQ